MNRHVQPEWLDVLPPEAPEARHSRRDLHRVNAWMGNPRHIADALRSILQPGPQPQSSTLVDLGSGDGRAILRVVERLPSPAARSRLILVDREPVVTSDTRGRLESRGWIPSVIQMDALRFVRDLPELGPSANGPVVVANLFLHHFEDPGLETLLKALAACAQGLVACEPRRSPMARMGALLLGLIGCNAVTRHDARVSVDAGFVGTELSGLWPANARWHCRERRAGLFSHLFVAHRRGA